MDLKSAVGVVIKKYRKQSGLSQMHVALAVGSDTSTISRIERGAYPPSLITLFLIAKAIDVSPWKIIQEAEEQEPDDIVLQ